MLGTKREPSQHSGTCEDCGHPIHVGDPIVYIWAGPMRHGKSDQLLIHADCAYRYAQDLERGGR